MLGCLEVLITAGEIILRIVVILFIPVFCAGLLEQWPLMLPMTLAFWGLSYSMGS